MIDPYLLDKGENYPYSASMFPIKYEKHLWLVEKKIDDDFRYRRFLVKEVSQLESETLVDLVKKIMTYLFDDKVLLGFGVFGKRTSSAKKDFLELRICGVIFAAITSKPQYEDSLDDIERKLKAHLSQSAYRIYRQFKIVYQ